MACLDVATAVGDAAMRCGQDAKANRDAFVNAVGGCESVKMVRDEGSLRMTCIPSLMTISCDDLIAGNLDDSCKGQLLK